MSVLGFCSADEKMNYQSRRRSSCHLPRGYNRSKAHWKILLGFSSSERQSLVFSEGHSWLPHLLAVALLLPSKWVLCDIFLCNQPTLQTILSCWWRKEFGALFVVVQVQNSDVSPTIFFWVLIPLIPKEICNREVRTLLKTFSTQNLRLFPQEVAW